MLRSFRKAETMKSQVLFLFLLSLLLGAISQQIQYSIPEELDKGSWVGNLAKDLRLSVQEWPARKLRISAEDFFSGQGGLVCCDSWGRKESDRTE